MYQDDPSQSTTASSSQSTGLHPYFRRGLSVFVESLFLRVTSMVIEGVGVSTKRGGIVLFIIICADVLRGSWDSRATDSRVDPPHRFVCLLFHLGLLSNCKAKNDFTSTSTCEMYDYQNC